MQKNLLRISVLLGTVAVTMLSYSTPSKSLIIRIKKNYDDETSAAHPRVRLTVDREGGSQRAPERHKETPAEYAARHAKIEQEKRERAEAYRRTLEQQAQDLGVSTYGDTSDLKASIQAEKHRQWEARKRERENRRRELVEQQAESLGVSKYSSYEEKERAIEKHRSEEREREHQAYLARRKWRAGEKERRELSAKLQQEEDDRLILRAAERKPGQRVDYRTGLEERHAFSRRGLYDAGLCRHSDDVVQQNMLDSYTRSYSDIVREVRERREKSSQMFR